MRRVKGSEPVPISKISQQDREALIYSLQRVISGVDNGTINTPQGARSTFKQALMEKGLVCNGRTCYLRKSLQKIADELTERTNFDTAETVRNSFKEFLSEVESGVDNGTTNTPQGTKNTFKQDLIEKGLVCTWSTCYLHESLQKIADELTERTNFDTTETVKNPF